MPPDAPRSRLTCAACSRRKVKCSKTVPCTNCVRRHEQDTCAMTTPPSTASPRPPDTIDSLKARIAHLEAQLQHQSHTPRPVSPDDDPVPAEDADAASILEFLAWGRRKQPAPSSPEATCDDAGAGAESDLLLGPEASQPAMLQLLLPDRRRVWQLVEWHERCLLWYHCSYYAPTLRRQLEAFYARHGGRLDNPGSPPGGPGPGVNMQWAALLFSVLAGSMTCVPPATAASWGYREAERETLSRRWVQATTACLERGDWTARHSVLGVQAVATLTISAHMLGFSGKQSIYLAAAVRVAQSLGLHRLEPGRARGSFAEDEAGRRAWAQLCIQDWFGLPFSETYLVSPAYSTSELPWNCRDSSPEEGQDPLPLPDDVPTVASFARFRCSIAAILPRLQDDLVSSNTPFTRYEHVVRYDRQLRSLATAGRPSFFSSSSDSAGSGVDGSGAPLPAYLPWARRALAISSSHKIIMIHRSFLSESLVNPAFAFTRRTCLAAAKTILNEYRCVVAEDGPVIWVHQAFSVAASIILVLDSLHRDPGDPEAAAHRGLVAEVVGILAGCRNSTVAERGVRLLTRLLEETAAGGAGVKRKADGDGRDGHVRRRRFDVGSFVRSFCQEQRAPVREQQSPDTTLVPLDAFADVGTSDSAATVENLLFLANHDFYSFDPLE